MKLKVETNDNKYTFLSQSDCDLTLIVRNGKIVEALEQTRKKPIQTEN